MNGRIKDVMTLNELQDMVEEYNRLSKLFLRMTNNDGWKSICFSVFENDNKFMMKLNPKEMTPLIINRLEKIESQFKVLGISY